MRDHNNERGERPTFRRCGNCGGYPVGIGCYHICFNSVHYYSREQERYDDAQGWDDRWEGYGDPELYDEADYDESEPSPFQVIGAVVYDAATDTLNDLPF